MRRFERPILFLLVMGLALINGHQSFVIVTQQTQIEILQGHQCVFDRSSTAAPTDMSQWYDRYNELYFHGELPPAVIRYTVLVGKMGETRQDNIGNFHIDIDRATNMADKTARLTLLHEMTHIWCDLSNVNEFDKHGKVWQDKMHLLANQNAFEDLW